jgi:hypothetical protein
MKEPSMVVPRCNFSELRRLRQEDLEFHASLHYETVFKKKKRPHFPLPHQRKVLQPSDLKNGTDIEWSPPSNRPIPPFLK